MSEASTVKAITDAAFSSEVLTSATPVLVDFWATWCGPCKMQARVLDDVANDVSDRLRIVKIDVDANPEAAEDYQVVSIPTMILFKNGKPLKKIVGAKGKAALMRQLSELL